MSIIYNYLEKNLLSLLSFLISLIGFLGLKLLSITLATGVLMLIEGFYGESVHNGISLIIGTPVIGLVFIGLQRFYPYYERLEEKVKKYNRLPYTEKYGKNYPKPKPEDFGITTAEFDEYKKRFQFEYIKLIFTYGVFIAVVVYLITSVLEKLSMIFILGFTGSIVVS